MSRHIHAELKPEGRACVYEISFSGDSRVYVGASTDFPRRRRQHLYLLRRGSHYNPHLQQAFYDFGEDAMLISVLSRCHQEDLEAEEVKAIREIPVEKRMNAVIDAKNPMEHDEIVSRWKRSLSEAERRRRSALAANVLNSDESRSKQRQAVNRFLDNGGRQILSVRCRDSENRKIAASESLKRRWGDASFRARSRAATKKSLGKRVIGAKLADGSAVCFASISDAAIYAGGSPRARRNIDACLNGKQKTAYGYTWEIL